MPHHANRGMTSVNQVFSILDNGDDSPDIKDVTPMTPVCPSYSSSGGYPVAAPTTLQRSQGGQFKRQRDSDDVDGHTGNNSSPPSSILTPTSLAMKQRDVSEFNYAQALLQQAPKLSSSRDLDGSSVLRLAQAYITLQSGLKSWKNSGNQTRWWPPNIDGGKLALAAQETMNCFVLIITSKGNVVYVSDAVETLLGHDQLNLVGRSVESLVPPEELPVLAEQFSSLPGTIRGTFPERSFYTRMLNVRSSGPHHQHFELVHAVGHIQEVLLASSNAGHRETWLMCACRVMSPQMESEGSGSPCTEWVSHNALDGTVIYMDARSCQVSGYLSKEVVGLSLYCFVHQEDQEHVAFSHNQALISVGGSSCTYRMYTQSQDIVYVHSTIQLARDKHSRKPKFLFCLHRLVDEHEGREQMAKHRQELMWVKSDPSIKYSMTDIERTVKALEVDGGNSPLMMSRGGMRTSVLSDSCAADGGDLLSVNLSNQLRVPVPVIPKLESVVPKLEQVVPKLESIPKLEPGLSTNTYCQQQGYSRMSPESRYQQHHGQIPLPASLPGSMAEYGGSYGGYDTSSSRVVQQQHMYGRQFSQQQHVYTNISPHYQPQTSQNNSAACQTLVPTGSNESPVSGNNTGSFDFFFDTSGLPSVSSDSQMMYNSDPSMGQAVISPSGRGRGRSRTRGRPRGSGRGGRGTTRGVRGTRMGRARGGRGRGRAGMTSQLSQSHEAMAGVRKSENLLSQSSLSPISIHGSMSPRSSLSPVAGSGDHLFMSPDSGMGLQRSSSTGGGHMHQQVSSSRSAMDFQQMSSEPESSGHLQCGNMADLQRMRSDDMFQRMSSLDGLDMLDPSQDFSLNQPPSLEMMSPRSWGTQDRGASAQMSPYRTVSSSDHMPGKRVGRPRGSRNKLERQQHFQRTMSIDDPSMSSILGFGPNQQSLYGRDSPYGQSPSFAGESSSHGTGSNVSYHSQSQQASSSIGSNSARGQDNLQRSLSFQNQASGRMTSDTDPEHSILGNLLKGRGGSTSSTGSKSPAQSTLMGRSPGHSAGPDRSGRSPLTQPVGCDKGGRSPAHSLISDAASPMSVFSPDSSRATPSVIKDDPEMMSSMEEPSCTPALYSPSQSQQQHQDVLNFVLEQGEPKVEMHIFSTQLRQKHHSLQQSLMSQETVLRQLESSIQQAAMDSSAEVLRAKLNLMKANKAKQEKELRAIQANLEAHLQQHQQQFQQQRPLQQHHSLQRHRINSPAPASTRRMAIVPPIQRQPTDGELNPAMSQASPGDVKPGHTSGGIQHSSVDVGAKQQIACTSLPESSGSSNPALMLTGQQAAARQTAQDTPLSADGSYPSVTPAQNSGQQLQPPQQSPYSLHHHHHHHHHYHHHPLPQQHLSFPSALKETPPPAYGSYDNTVFTSSAAAAAAASGSITPSALSISVSSTTASLASPIICDTSPVSVDESPSCASDASSGYHSLSHSADALTNLCVGSFNKPHCLDMASTSTGPIYGSKTPPGYEQAIKSTSKSPDMIPSSTYISSTSPPV